MKIIYTLTWNAKPIFWTQDYMKYRTFFLCIIFILLLASCIWYISWWTASLQLFFSLWFYIVLFYILSLAFNFVRRKPRTVFQDFIIYIFPKITAWIASIILIILCFSFYNNILSPAQMPLYTLSNGVQTLKFQTMSHVASESFYKQVQKNITQSKQDNYVLFYEWVGPGSKESLEIFNEALEVDFSKDLYTNFWDLYGVSAQNNNDFLWLENNQDYNIDLNLDEIIKIYNTKQINTSQQVNEETNSEVLDINSEILSLLSNLNQRELAVVRFFNQSIMNFMIGQESLRETLLEQSGKTDIFSVILDERNEHLVDEILKNEHQKIHILYGLMHFEWVYKLLQASDPRWEIIQTQYSQVIDSL